MSKTAVRKANQEVLYLLEVIQGDLEEQMEAIPASSVPSKELINLIDLFQRVRLKYTGLWYEQNIEE